MEGDGVTEDHSLTKRPWLPHPTSWEAIRSHPYPGSGSEQDPYVVSWLDAAGHPLVVDTENPMSYTKRRKWFITMIGAFSSLAVTMGSSMLSAAIAKVEQDFPNRSSVEYTMVTNIFVLGFVVGPLIWAPCSEVFGRRVMLVYTFIPFTIFCAACCGAKSLDVLLAMRFLAGVCGSSSLVTSGGVIADMFSAKDRGVAMGLFTAAPFLGPAIGPVGGGFLSEAASWRWVAAVIACFAGLLTVIGCVYFPETYSPVLLRRRAALLNQSDPACVYRSSHDIVKPLRTKELFTRQLLKPWELLFMEPIVLLMALYTSVIYAILYMQFTSFPLVFQKGRGWSPGIGGLAFCGITVGAFFALGYLIFVENPRYGRLVDNSGGYVPPEQRLPLTIVGAVIFPAALYMFAWTGMPKSIPWILPIIATVLFGAGLVFLFMGLINYLIDTYLLFSASVLAGNTVIRSIFGLVLPLFTVQIYDRLGLQIAGTLIATLAVLFLPAPIIFYLYGRRIRRMSKYARDADDMGMKLTGAHATETSGAVSSAPLSGVELEVQYSKDEEKDIATGELPVDVARTCVLSKAGMKARRVTEGLQ